MPRIDDLERAVQDLRRQLAALQRVDVNPPLTSTPKYSGTPTAGHYAAWSGAGTVVDSGFGTADLPRYSGTPTANALAYWPGAGTVAGAASITVDGSNNRIGIGTVASATFPVYLQKTSNAAMGYAVENLSNGNAAQAFIEALNDAGNPLKMGILGSGFSTSGVYTGDLGFVQADSSDLLINAGGAHTLLLATNNTERARISSGGVVMIGLTSVGASQLGIQAGASANDAAVGGVLYEDHAVTGQVGAGPDTLSTYTIPAATLSANGQSIRWRAGGIMAVGATSGVIKVVYGATTVLEIDASPASNGAWFAEGDIIRTGAAAQRSIAWGLCDQGSTKVNAISDTTPAETLSGTVTLKVTGNSSSAANNDTVSHMLKVFFDDANT